MHQTVCKICHQPSDLKDLEDGYCVLCHDVHVKPLVEKYQASINSTRYHQLVCEAAVAIAGGAGSINGIETDEKAAALVVGYAEALVAELAKRGHAPGEEVGDG